MTKQNSKVNVHARYIRDIKQALYNLQSASTAVFAEEHNARRLLLNAYTESLRVLQNEPEEFGEFMDALWDQQPYE